MKTLTVIDDFYFAPQALLRAAQGLDYSTKEYEGHKYNGVSVDFTPENMQGLIGLSLGKPVQLGINYFRLGVTTEKATTHIHADNAIEPFAAVLYLNDAPEGVRAGTAFWRHKKYGLDAMPTPEWIKANTEKSVEDFIKELNDDGNDESNWSLSLVGQKANRFVTYPSHIFHSRYPQEAWARALKTVALSGPDSTTTLVKPITVEQLAEVAQMGPAFWAEGSLPGTFVPAVFCAKWRSLIEQGIGFMLGLYSGDKLVGAFGAIVAEDLNDAALVANECFWFVKPEARGRGFELLIAYEEEARRRGAVRCSMIHLLTLQPEKLAHIYERRGYLAVETSYFKELT